VLYVLELVFVLNCSSITMFMQHYRAAAGSE